MSKYGKIFSIVAKGLVFVFLVYLLYYQVTKQEGISELFREFAKNLTVDSFVYGILAVVLMIFNWGIEAKKWKIQLTPILKIRFRHSFKAILSGVTLGIFTPNRIGEYGGRILFLNKEYRVEAIFATLIGSFSQIIATITCGTVAGWFFIYKQYNLDGYSLAMVIFLSFLTLIFLIFAYLNVNWIVYILERVKKLQKIRNYLTAIDHYSQLQLLNVLKWSFIRYIVFTTQYILLLNLFGIDLPIPISTMLVSVIFLVHTIIPSFAIAELFTRGNIAIFFFSLYSDNSLGVISASTSLWLINLIIPALVGYLFIARLDLSKLRL